MTSQLVPSYFTFCFVSKSLNVSNIVGTARSSMSSIEYPTRNPSLGLPNGPHDFNKENVKNLVEKKRLGNYAIGYSSPIGGFIPRIIGRSDKDLQEELLNRNDVARQKGYDKFCFKYADSLKESFERECLNYHTYQRQLEDKMHPISSDGNDLKCPDRICAQFFKSGKINRP
jgi:hypothetical protein